MDSSNCNETDVFIYYVIVILYIYVFISSQLFDRYNTSFKFLAGCQFSAADEFSAWNETDYIVCWGGPEKFNNKD